MRRLMVITAGTGLAVALGAASIAMVQSKPAMAQPRAGVDIIAAPLTVTAPDEAPVETPEPALARGGVLEELVEEGVITQEQADVIRSRFKERAPHGQGRAAMRRPTARLFSNARQVALEAVGITQRELRTAIAGGRTFGEVAEANGASRRSVVAALMRNANNKIDQLVSAERITATRAASLRDNLPELANRLVERMWDRPNRRAA